jgi:hypothetical protein
MSRLWLLLPLAVLTGCVTGNNYPTQYAQAYCDALFTCVPGDAIEFWSGGWDDVEECEEGAAEIVTDTPDYEAYEEGDREFNSDNANTCIEEVAEIKNDSSCTDDDGNPSMGIVDFTFDAATEACGEVYEEGSE